MTRTSSVCDTALLITNRNHDKLYTQDVVFMYGGPQHITCSFVLRRGFWKYVVLYQELLVPNRINNLVDEEMQHVCTSRFCSQVCTLTVNTLYDYIHLTNFVLKTIVNSCGRQFQQ